MTDQQPFGEYVAALAQTTADCLLFGPSEGRAAVGVVDVRNPPSRTGDGSEQISLFVRARRVSPSRMFGICHAGRTVVPPRQEVR